MNVQRLPTLSLGNSVRNRDKIKGYRYSTSFSTAPIRVISGLAAVCRVALAAGNSPRSGTRRIGVVEPQLDAPGWKKKPLSVQAEFGRRRPAARETSQPESREIMPRNTSEREIGDVW